MSPTDQVEQSLSVFDQVFDNSMKLEKEMAAKKESIQKRESELTEMAAFAKERKEKLDRREADIAVIVRRIKKKYEEDFPGRKLTI